VLGLLEVKSLKASLVFTRRPFGLPKLGVREEILFESHLPLFVYTRGVFRFWRGEALSPGGINDLPLG